MPETIAVGILLLGCGSLLAGLGYCVKKIWEHDKDLAEIRAQLKAQEEVAKVHIANLCETLVRHQQWMEEINRCLKRIDRRGTLIAAKLGLQDEEWDG